MLFERPCKDNDEVTANFGFKSVKTAPKNDNLNRFESDFYDMAQNIEFKKVISNLRIQLSNDVKNIKKNPKLFIPADKNNNLYELTSEKYNKFLIGNINKTYKKSTMSPINAINTEAKAVPKGLSLDERIEQYNHNQSFITLRGHKGNFQNNPKCRLINPAKTKEGIASIHYTDKINKSI